MIYKFKSITKVVVVTNHSLIGFKAHCMRLNPAQVAQNLRLDKSLDHSENYRSAKET